ncbi:MAG: DUF3568 family protein [Opitutae bacterium]|nr:DUF3568 family protein [Opitutae bacterium]
MTTLTRKRCLHLVTALLLGATLTLHSGCLVLAAGAGAGTVAFIRGELESTLSAKYDPAVRASERALDQLKFARISTKTDALVTVLVARTADDKRIEIKVSTVGEGVTKVQIRVGIFGDEALSLRILERIKAAL